MTTMDLDQRWVDAGGSVDELEHLEIIDQGLARFLSVSVRRTSLWFGSVNGVFQAAFYLGDWNYQPIASFLCVTASANEPNLFDAALTRGSFPSIGKTECVFRGIAFDEVVGLAHKFSA